MSGARAGPAPGTTWVADRYNGQRVHSASALRSAESVLINRPGASGSVAVIVLPPTKAGDSAPMAYLFGRSLLELGFAPWSKRKKGARVPENQTHDRVPASRMLA